MANKQYLYDMVDKIINKKGDDAARVDFHSFAKEKMRELLAKDQKTTPEKNNGDEK